MLGEFLFGASPFDYIPCRVEKKATTTKRSTSTTTKTSSRLPSATLVLVLMLRPRHKMGGFASLPSAFVWWRGGRGEKRGFSVSGGKNRVDRTCTHGYISGNLTAATLMQHEATCTKLTAPLALA